MSHNMFWLTSVDGKSTSSEWQQSAIAGRPCQCQQESHSVVREFFTDGLTLSQQKGLSIGELAENYD